jgi:hypothetical protein
VLNNFAKWIYTCGVKTQLFSSKRFFEKFCEVFVKNGILQSAKQFFKVDLDSWGQNITFFFQAFFDKIFDGFVKTSGVRQSTKSRYDL